MQGHPLPSHLQCELNSNCILIALIERVGSVYMTVYICMCCFLYGGTSLNIECLVYSVVAQGPPHLASGMGFLELESLKDALGGNLDADRLEELW